MHLEQALIEAATTQGIWVLLFVSLFILFCPFSFKLPFLSSFINKSSFVFFTMLLLLLKFLLFFLLLIKFLKFITLFFFSLSIFLSIVFSFYFISVFSYFFNTLLAFSIKIICINPSNPQIGYSISTK